MIAVGLIIFGLAAGALTAAGYFAVITSVGMINRVADVTHTKMHLLFYEELLIIGAVFGNIVSVFAVGGELMALPENGWFEWIMTAFLVLYGVVSGMFIGLFVVCLAETTKVLPIFLRRVRIGDGLGIIILMIGLGKAIGQIIYYLVLYAGG